MCILFQRWHTKKRSILMEENKKMFHSSPRKVGQDKNPHNDKLPNQEDAGDARKGISFSLEKIFWLLMIFSWAVSQIVFNITSNKYLLLITVGIASLFILILLYHSLFPLRISIDRISSIIIALLVIWLSVHPAFY